MNDDLAGLAKLISGRDSAAYRGMRSDAEKLLSQVGTAHGSVVSTADTLLGAVQKLDQALAKAKELNQATLEELASLQAENQALKEGVKAAKDDFAAQVAALGERVALLENEKNEVIDAKDRQLQTIQSAADARTEELNQEQVKARQREKENELQRERLQRQIADLQKKIQGLKPETFRPEALLTKADGRILRAIPGSDVVYLNLGSNDGLRLGMGFEVYSAAGDAPKDLRGKASLEVTTLMPDSCECRVARTTPGSPIVEGDYVVNLAYERNRKPKFVVVGEFDLDFNGELDPDGLDRVVGMIRMWGGQVVPELDETTEFLVVGRSPTVPERRPDQPISTVLEDQRRTKLDARGAFAELVQRANSLYIPVVNQSQFLILMGYSGERQVAAR
jgi:hypothetical protein